MKKFFGVFTVGLLCAVSNFPLQAGKLDPQVIFEEKQHSTATLPQHTTKASTLHKEGIEGQCKDGKRLKAAIIDQGFHPNSTKKLIDNIDPFALSENFIYGPDATPDLAYLSELAFNDRHGSGAMGCLPLIVPKAQFLPIETARNGPNRNIEDISVGSLKVAHGIREAIKHGADVINLSLGFKELDLEVLKACKEASDAGVPLIFAAGNDSKYDYPVFLDETKVWEDPFERSNVYRRDPQIDIWKHLDGKGIRFAGALKYKKDGEETLSDFTHHPTSETKKHIIFTAGEEIFSPSYGGKCGGTSASVPILAGGYLLLKQFVLDNKYSLSAEEILDIMYVSGRDVSHSFKNSTRTDIELPEEVIYKALDLENAKKKIEEKCKKPLLIRALPPIPSQVLTPVVRALPVIPQQVAIPVVRALPVVAPHFLWQQQKYHISL